MSNQETPFKTPLKLSDVDGRPCLIDHNNQVVAFGVWSQVSVGSVAEDVRLLSGIRDCVNAHADLVAACDTRGLRLVLDALRSDVANGFCGSEMRTVVFESRCDLLDDHIKKAALALADPGLELTE